MKDTKYLNELREAFTHLFESTIINKGGHSFEFTPEDGVRAKDAIRLLLETATVMTLLLEQGEYNGMNARLLKIGSLLFDDSETTWGKYRRQKKLYSHPINGEEEIK